MFNAHLIYTWNSSYTLLMKNDIKDLIEILFIILGLYRKSELQE